MMVFGGQRTTKKISLECVFHFLFASLGGDFLSSRKETHVYRDNRRDSDNYCAITKYHAHHHHRTTKCTLNTPNT